MKVKTFSRLIACFCVISGLAACDARPRSEIDGKSLLDIFGKEGPQVGGVSDALRQSAKEAEDAGDYGRALQFYKQLADKYPDDVSYQLSLAENLRRVNKLDDAISAYDSILRKTPNHVEALEGKGLALFAKSDFPNASDALETVMRIAPNRWRTLNGIGLLFVAKNMPNEAVSYFDAALAQSPDHPTVLNNVGLTLALTQDYDRAIAALNRASGKVSPKSLERERIDLNLALVLGLSGDMDRAEKVASQHLTGAALQNNLGFYAKLAGDNGLAKAYLNSALSGSPTFYEKAWDNLEDH